MNKRLGTFVRAARHLTWPQFIAKYNDYVVVIVPSDKSESTPGDTSEDWRSPFLSRPELDASYRVGILQKRYASSDPAAPLTIGRERVSDIYLKDITVSRIHAFVEHVDGNWTIRDNASMNGTFVNNRLIADKIRVKIRSRDTLKFGTGISAVFFSPDDFYQFLITSEAIKTIGPRT